MNRYHNRFQDLEWYGPSLNILIGGLGGIGSWLTLFLSRIGHKIYCYEMDDVEEQNIGGQLYGPSHIGRGKDRAMKEVITYLCGDTTFNCFGKCTDKSMSNSIVFTCFDNMESRKIMFESWRQSDKRRVFIDIRMQAEFFEIFCVQAGDESKYEKYLFGDEEVPDLPCSARATSHCGAMSASMAVSILNNYLTNEIHPGLREVPFHTQVTLPLMMIDIKNKSE